MISRKVILILAACVFPLNAGEIPEKAERYRTMLLRKPENPVLFGRMLDAWLEEKELEALKPELELRAKEGTAADWRLLAVFHEHSGDEDAALKALDEAVNLSPDDVAARLARGKALGAALRFDAALEDLAIAVKDKAIGVEAGTLRGKLLARAGRPVEAVKAWQELIAANPADEGLKEDLIELEIGEGMLEEAVAAARELADKTEDPYKKALRRLQVAEIFGQAGKKDESLKEYREVFAVSAEGSWLELEVLARAGALFSREDDAGGLKAFLDELRDAYPRRVAVKKEAAKSLLAAGEEDEAVAMFREVLKVMPGDREVREEFIALLEGAGRHKDAAEEVTSLLDAAKDDAVLWERLAVLKKTLADEAGLKEALDKAVALTPDDEAGQVARARLLERFERLADSEKTLRDAVAKHGKAGEAGEALAGFLIAQNKGDEAVAMWKEMAAEADREGLLRIARSLSAHGKATEAFAMLQPRVKDFPNDPLLLAALCAAAQLSDDPEAAVPQAMELVRQAESPTDLDAALRQATALVARAKDPRKWLDELSKKPDPTIQERCLLAEMYETLGDSIEAEKVLKDAMAGDDTLLAATQRVRLQEMRGNSDAAVAAMREMMAMPGGTKTAHVKRLVELLERAGNFDGALAETMNWLKLAPGDKLAWSKRAELFLGEGRPAEAVAELRRALAKFGGDEELRAKLADAMREAGMNEEAWRSYTALYDEAESPASKLKWTASLARMAALEGKEDELVKDFRRRSRDNPSSVVPLLALAEMFKEWGNADEEMKCVAEALRRKPEDSALRFRLADMEEQSGSPEKAEAMMRGMLSGPDAPEARRRMAAYWIRQGETERGLREMLDGNKNADPRMLERMIMALAAAKEWEQAAKVLERESGARPEDWRLAYFHAVTVLEAGDKKGAFDKFAALLSADGELKGTTPLTAARGGYGYPGMSMPVQAVAPPTRLAIPGFRRLQGQAFLHRGERDHYYGGGTPGEVALPGSPQEVRSLALLQALAIAKEDGMDREPMLAKLQSPHLDDLATLKRAYYLGVEDLKAELMKDDVDPALFRWKLENENYQETPQDSESMLHGVRIGLAKDADLALMLAGRVGYGGEKGLPAAEVGQLLDLIEKMEGNKRASALGPLSGMAFSDELPEETRKRAEKLLIESSKEQKASNWIIAYMPMNWMRQGRFDEAAEWINRTTAENAAKDAQMQNHGMPWQYRMQQMGMSDQPGLAYPAILQEVVPNSYQELLGDPDSQRKVSEVETKLLKILGDEPVNGRGQQREIKPIDREGLAKIAPKIADRALRVLFYQAADKEKEVEREVAEIAKSPDATTSELVVAAAYRLSVGKSNVDAFALLSKARELPKAGAWRERIDLELVKLGIQLSAGKAEVADLEAARRAALRMRKSSGFNPEMKNYLADAMNKLGMEEESRRFTAAPVAVMSGRNPYSSMRGGMRSSRGGVVNEITKLVRDGKREAAARRMLGEIRKASGNPNSRYELDQLYETAVSLKLADEMAKAGAPSPDSGFNRRKDHALMLIRLGKKDAASPILRVLSEEKPKEMSIRAALFSALPAEEQKVQLQFVVEGEFDADALSEMFKQWLGAQKSERQFEAIGALTNFLENLKPSFEGDRNLSWVNYLVKQFVQGSNLEVPVRPLLGNVNKDAKFDEGVSKKRDELAGGILRAMLKHPQTSEQGFILLYAMRERLGVPVEELDKAALSAVRASLRLSNANSRQHYYMNSGHYVWAWIRGNGSSSSGNPPEGGQPPSVHLSRRAAEGFAVEVLDDAFLKELAASDPKTSAMMERCLKVVGGEGASAFESWAKEAEERKNEMSRELVWIVRLAESRKRPDLLKLAQEHAAKLVLKGDQRQHELGSVLVTSVTGAKDAATRLAELERVATLLLGPTEAWPLYAQLDQNSYIPGVQYRRQAFQSFIQRLSENKAAAMAGCRFVVRHGLGAISQLDESYLWQIISYQPTVADLLDSGLLDPGPEPAGSIDQQESESMAGDLVQRLRNQSDRSKKNGEELLKVEGERRFWARLVGAALTGNTEAAMKEISRDKAVIAKWSGSERERFAKFVSSTFSDALEKADGPTRKMLADSMKKGDDESRKLAEGYLKDGMPPNFQPWSVSESITPLVIRLAGEDVVMAAKLWARVIEACRAHANSGWGSSSNGFQGSPESYVHDQLFDQFMEKKTPLPVFFSFIAEFSKQDAASLVGVADGNFRYNLEGRFTAEENARKSAASKDKEIAALHESVRTFAGVRTGLGKDTPKEARPILAAVTMLADLYNPPDPEATRTRAFGWAKNDLKKIDPALSNSTVLALLANDASNLDDAAKKELREAFVAFVADKSIPPDCRFIALLPLFNKDAAVPLLDEPACARAMAGLLATYLTPERHWASSESVQLVSRFAAWRSTASEDARSIMQKIAASRISYESGTDGDAARAMVGTMILDLALRGGDAAEIGKAVQAGGSAVKGRIDLAVKLWQHQLGPQAVTLIARPGEFHQGARSLFFENKEPPVDPPKFTREMEQALPEWLKGIEDPAQRFRVECLISSFKDAEGDAAPQAKQEPRLEALMKRFATEGPKPRAARMETLAALCTAALKAQVLEEEILPLIKGADFGTLLVTRGDGSSNNAAELNETYVLECLIRRAMRYPLERNGDASVFLAQVEALATAGIGNLKWSVQSTMSNFFNWYAALTTRRIAELPQAERAAITANVRRICEPLLAFEDESTQHYAMGFLIASHALAGEGAAMDKWLAELPEGSRKAYEEARKSYGLRTAFSNLKQWPLTGDEFKASRLLVLTALLTEPVTVAREIKHPTELSAILDSGLFGRDELFAVIDGLPAEHPQKAKFLAEKAGIIGWRTNEKEEAIKNYDAADAAAKASGDPKSIAYARAYRAAYLDNRQGKLAEAVAIAKEINPDDLEQKEREWMENIMKKAAEKK